MSDIFICYSKTDRAIATRLGQRLRDEGWSVFMDVQTHVGRRGAPSDGPAWEGGEKGSRVLRGGSGDGAPRYCRAANRNNNPPDNRNNNIGFRVCCAAHIVIIRCAHPLS